jgi:hypothetical protein
LAGIGQYLARQRRGEEHQGWQPVDVVLNDLAAEHDQPDQLDVDATVGLHARCANARQVSLLVGEQAVRDGLADVQPEQAGCLRGHHELIGATGIGHPALDDRRPVLFEVKAVDAGGRVDLGQVTQGGGPGRSGAALTSTQASTCFTPGKPAIWFVSLAE